MNPTAVETFSTFGVGIFCIALAIMALSLFYAAMNWVGRRGAKPEALAIRGVLKEETRATVHMSGPETFEHVRFVGFTSTEGAKTHLPFDLNGMVILEDRQKRRFLVRAKAIRMIVVEPESNADVTD